LALAMQTETTNVETVLAACFKIYAAQRIAVEPIDSIDLRDDHRSGAALHGIVAGSENKIEVVIPHEAELSPHRATFEGWARAGWDVWVLVPAELMGPAHRHLRGADLNLQPWWESGPEIFFGRPELP
jgi:hypothetical protein